MNSRAFTAKGGRATNQDAFLEAENLYIVCDGVGGRPYGDVASKLACSSLAAYFELHKPTPVSIDFLHDAINYTTAAFIDCEQRYAETKNMATTFVLLYFDDKQAHIGWIGDSRLYHIQRGKIQLATEDHSLANQLRKLGNTKEDELSNIRNVITKSVSAEGDTSLSYQTIPLSAIEKGDYFFLCTDGVLENISDKTLEQLLAENEDICIKEEKIKLMCEGKTKDNFTFILIEVG